MAQYKLLFTDTKKAAADLSAAQYHIVRLSSANQINIASQDTHASMYGVLQNKPKSGEFGTVALYGITKVVIGADVTVNAFLTTNGSGRAVDATSGDLIIGRALEDGGADGETITAEVFRPWRIFTAP